MFKDAIKEYAYQCAMNDLEDNYVSLDEFTAEEKKVQVGFYYLFNSGRQCYS